MEQDCHSECWIVEATRQIVLSLNIQLSGEDGRDQKGGKVSDNYTAFSSTEICTVKEGKYSRAEVMG